MDEVIDQVDSVDTPTPDTDSGDKTPALDKDGKPIEAKPQEVDKRLSDTEAALKERQREFHELSHKLAELKGQLSMVTVPKQEPIKDWLDDEKLAEKLRDDPSAAIEVVKQERFEFLRLLDMRDQAIFNEMQKRSPEFLENAEKIKELKADPEYAGFSDQQLATIARKTQAPVVKTPRGVPGGGSRNVSEKPEDIKNSDLFKAIYGQD